MHLAANRQEWFAAAADKILFHLIMTGAGIPVPDLLCITQRGRHLDDGRTMADADRLCPFLRTAPAPLFAKPVGGKFSLGIFSIDAIDPATDDAVLLGGARMSISDLSRSFLEGAGYLIQRRLLSHVDLAARFGPRLWSVRVLVFISANGSTIHRATLKIATGQNPADNFWRPGNLLGAVDAETGAVRRVVQGTGVEFHEIAHHPDTGASFAGLSIPRWDEVQDVALRAAAHFPGIRTQSWDIALSDNGPVALELNFGGDLNLHQLAHGAGVLDDRYREHLRRCGYRGRL